MKKKHKRFSSVFLALLLANILISAGFAEPSKKAPQKNTIRKTFGLSAAIIDSMEVDIQRRRYLRPEFQKWIYNSLYEGQQYRIYVRNELEKRKMPSIIEYIPMVESGYKPNAKAKGADSVGMWQFLPNSVHGLLELNEYVDERLDPWKSTNAALTKLKYNYDMFSDWLLAITAYNFGAGALSRAIKKADSKDLWYLIQNDFLSVAAASYVPKLIAFADLIENEKFYGLDFPQGRAWNGTTLETRAGCFDYVTVSKQVSLKNLAYELRIDEEMFLGMNSALIKKVTPPDKKYSIRFPEGMKDSATYALNQLGIFPLN